MIPAEKLAEWKALAEAAPPVRLGEQPIYLETEDGRHVAAVGLVAGPHVDDLRTAKLFAAARPAILALVAEVERLQKDAALGLAVRAAAGKVKNGRVAEYLIEAYFCVDGGGGMCAICGTELDEDGDERCGEEILIERDQLHVLKTVRDALAAEESSDD